MLPRGNGFKERTPRTGRKGGYRVRKGKGFQAEDRHSTKARRISEKKQPVQGIVTPRVRSQQVPRMHVKSLQSCPTLLWPYGL